MACLEGHHRLGLGVHRKGQARGDARREGALAQVAPGGVEVHHDAALPAAAYVCKGRIGPALDGGVQRQLRLPHVAGQLPQPRWRPGHHKGPVAPAAQALHQGEVGVAAGGGGEGQVGAPAVQRVQLQAWALHSADGQRAVPDKLPGLWAAGGRCERGVHGSKQTARIMLRHAAEAKKPCICIDS